MDEIELTAEEKLTVALSDETEENLDQRTRHERLSKKNETAIIDFLGDKSRAVGEYHQSWYYGDLLAWSTQCVLKNAGWQIINVFGYHQSKAIYSDVKVSLNDKVNCLLDGQLLIEKDGFKLLLTLDARSRGINCLQVEALESQQKNIDELIEQVTNQLVKNNFYRSKKICLKSGGIVFIDAGRRDWESVILEPSVKKEIRLNTVRFLAKLEVWQKYGIPAKRGIILAGAPGTGKTIVCKALATEAEGISCLFADSGNLANEGYVTCLYDVAHKINPCIIFIED